MKVNLSYEEIKSIIESDAKLKKILRDKHGKISKDNLTLEQKIERNKLNNDLRKLKGRLEIWTKLFPELTHQLDSATFIKKNRICEECGADYRWMLYSDDNLTEQFEQPKTQKEFDASDLGVSFEGGNEFDNIQESFDSWGKDYPLCKECESYLKSQKQQTLLSTLDNWKKEDKAKG